MKRWIVLAAALVMASCASVPQGPQSRQEWEAQHARVFTGKTPEEVLAAAEQVLRLADSDFTFDYPDGELVATRPWGIYMVVAGARGVDYWRVRAAPVEGGTRATVEISTESSTTTATPMATTGPSVWGLTSSASPGQPVRGDAPYNLFWSRVEYMLGTVPIWFTCDAFKSGRRAPQRVGLDTLCSVTTDDRAP